MVATLAQPQQTPCYHLAHLPNDQLGLQRYMDKKLNKRPPLTMGSMHTPP